MSKFYDTYNDDVVECPYCHYKYYPEAEDYDEYKRGEECGECGKSFYLYQSFSVSHNTSADCELNNGKHDYQLYSLPDGRTHPFCTVCDKCQPHSEIYAKETAGDE